MNILRGSGTRRNRWYVTEAVVTREAREGGGGTRGRRWHVSEAMVHDGGGGTNFVLGYTIKYHFSIASSSQT